MAFLVEHFGGIIGRKKKAGGGGACRQSWEKGRRKK
jgi:hypothetical protein